MAEQGLVSFPYVGPNPTLRTIVERTKISCSTLPVSRKETDGLRRPKKMAKANEVVVEGVPESLQSAMDSAVAQFGAGTVKSALIASVQKILANESEPIVRAREVLAALTRKSGGRPVGSRNTPKDAQVDTAPVA